MVVVSLPVVYFWISCLSSTPLDFFRFRHHGKVRRVEARRQIRQIHTNKQYTPTVLPLRHSSPLLGYHDRNGVLLRDLANVRLGQPCLAKIPSNDNFVAFTCVTCRLMGVFSPFPSRNTEGRGLCLARTQSLQPFRV